MLGVRVVCLWPGLPGAWLRGKVHHLFIALAAAWGACFLLLATFVWPQWISLVGVRLLWCIGLTIWIGFTLRGHWQYASLVRRHAPEQSAAFIKAQEEYLRGNWFAAEAQLLAILQSEPRDAESLLLLVCVLRQTRRWQPALRRLQQLELLETANPWQYEIARERVLIGQAMQVSVAAAASESMAEGANDELSLSQKSSTQEFVLQESVSQGAESAETSTENSDAFSG